MKRLIVFALLLCPVYSLLAADTLEVTLFYSPQCKHCVEFKKETLPGFKEKYKNEVVWRELNTLEKKENQALLIAVSGQFKRQGALIPSVLVGNTFLVGAIELREKLDAAIDEALEHKTAPLHIEAANLVDVFSTFSLATVISGGLIDGINPCAFAVIVFFVSFLSVYGYRKRDIVCVGIFYCLAVFVTYLLLGLGVFQFLYTISGFYAVLKIFYWFVAVFCFVLAGLSLRDRFIITATGESQDLILQLPGTLKKKIHNVIGGQLRRKERSLFGLAMSSLVVGFLVSLLEAACTSQVYIPTIVFILQNAPVKTKALGYLLLYNLMFILPLVLVFLLSLAGMSSQKFSDFLKKNLGAIKIIMAALFLGLGLLVIGDDVLFALKFYASFIQRIFVSLRF
ncbi:MAG: hypothetical protein ABH865_04485 [Candidatus Omnitrophota bacterium]